MEKSFFFNAVVTDGVADRSYSAEDIAQREACLISDGVIGRDSLMPTGSGGNVIYLDPGAAMISGYTYLNTAVLSISISNGDSDYDRIDTVCVKLDLSARTIRTVVVMGFPAAQPKAYVPAATASAKYLPICEITVPAGTTPAIETEDIRDRRVLAGHLSLKDDIEMILDERLGDLDPATDEEWELMRQVISMVGDSYGGDAVLCGDGKYRKISSTARVVAAEYSEPGEYAFDPGEHVSDGGVYDVEVQGAGGGGGSHNGTDARGGGGGGGAYVCVSRIALRDGAVKVVVGEGGNGVPGGDGEDGGHSAFDGFYAEGGRGGMGGSLVSGGDGGVGMFRGESGADGVPASDGVIYTSCGRGGYSRYGDGALSAAGNTAAAGNDAEHPGAGGSGGSAEAGTFSLPGGKGGDGRVVVWKYVSIGDTEVAG